MSAGKTGFYLAGAAALIVALVAVVALGASKKGAETREAKERQSELAAGPVVQTALVKRDAGGRTVTFSAEARAYKQTTLYAKVSGYLRYIRVDKGDRVKQNDVLGVVESPETESQVSSQQADLAIKKLTNQRQALLARQGLAAEQDVDQAQANVAIANAALAGLQALRGYETIRAPFDGIVTARYADPGALLQAATSSVNAQPLVDVADIDRLRITLFLGQSEASFVHEGDTVDVWSDERPEPKLQAKVTRFSHALDARTRTMVTEVELDNKDHVFFPGTFVHARLKLATPPSLVMPADALLYRDGKSQVVVVKNGRATFVPADVDVPDGQTVRVVSGLQEGDVVVLHPSDEIVEGGAVQAAPIPPPTASK